MSILFALHTAVVIGAGSDVIVGRMFGQEYLNGGSAVALRILVWAFCLNVISGPVGTFVIACGVNIFQFAPYAASIAVLNIVLNSFLIPRYDFYGASVSTVICSAANLIIKIYWVNRLLADWKVVLRILVRPTGAAGLMALVMYWLRGMGLAVTLPVGLATYLAVLVGSGELTRKDIGRIRSVGSELGNRAKELILMD
ncbi:hypothetical protein AMJ82_09795 [candidate division TA06 bacterium SM23_40]|uniref:Uncharacterized protein n=1 Tax=candidate division TA06 bacterium SM23_40 TaxID=1703774 RepID=A0A0S8G5J0_UNCT6|nr:MAG: hypothetical protein AMJ82_09795 [candidate division TA06 bacterium SM23_40]